MHNMIKHLTYIAFALLLLLAGCYDDKGNYDYTVLAELNIALPATSYNRMEGTTLEITPAIDTDIPESDLAYVWEVGCSAAITGNRPEFRSIAEGKDLLYTCSITELMPSPGTYTLRLHATQLSTGRDFYSEMIDLTISGITGMMVLHDDGTTSDIGLIVANEFRPQATSEEVEQAIYPHYFSENNDGQTIEGVGQYLTQLQGGSSSFHNYHSVLAVTDETSLAASYAGLSMQEGGWNSALFYGGLNKGIPQNIVYEGGDGTPTYTYINVYVFDGGEIFARQNSEWLLRPSLGNNNAYLTGFDFAPYIIIYSSSVSGSIQAYLYDQGTRGFVATTNIVGTIRSNSPEERYLTRFDEGTMAGAEFDLSNMQARMLYMARGGTADHILAIMERDNGERFLAELDMTTGTDFRKIPVAIYEMNNLPYIEEATHWGFVAEGNTVYANYYAAPQGVYRFTVDGAGSSITADPLTLLAGGTFTPDGEVTMMKVINHLGRDVLIVATYNSASGEGILYTMTIDPVNGLVSDVTEYRGFSHITDVCLKHL